MAALDTPWLTHMSVPRSQRADSLDASGAASLRPPNTPSRNASSYDSTAAAPAATPSSGANATYAAFSPATLSAASAAKRRSTILVHQKSPLLLATPPQITRALAYSHPFLLPLNKLAGLLSWTTDDPWESFLLVVAWWAIVLYGDIVVRVAGPIVLVLALIAGMYGRRYSPLSSSGWSDEFSGGGSSGGASRSARSAKNKSLSLDGVGASSMIWGMGGGGGSGTGGAQGKGANNKNKNGDDSSGSGSSGHQRSASAVTGARHQKTLDEIVETLKEFTARCNVLLEPLLELTDFLSTQRTPTSATTRPALTALFVRILLCTPFWAALTLPPLRIITTRRVFLVIGTVGLTWHSRVMRVSRTILWRSGTIRRLVVLVTGLQFEGPMRPTPAAGQPPAMGTNNAAAAGEGSAAATAGKAAAATASRLATPRESELTKAIRRARGGHDAGVRFTFIIYENQRKWVGLGWTTSLFAYERPAWTDEHNNAVPPRDQFELPEVEDGSRMRWRWVEGGRWRVEGVPDDAVKVEKTGETGEQRETWDYDGEGGRMGWVYYDNKWQNGRRGLDSWGRWTRRRKWYRDAELVEVDPDELLANEASNNGDEQTPTPASSSSLPPAALPPRPPSPAASQASTTVTAGPPIHTGENTTAYTSTERMMSASPAAAATAAMPRNNRRHSKIDHVEEEKGEDNDGGSADSVSMLSSSSKSLRFRPPSLRRRLTAESSNGVASASASALASASAPAIPAAGRSRRASEAISEDDAASSLGTRLGLEMQGAGRSGWGIGDEARMALE